jgi:hypothetical protein
LIARYRNGELVTSAMTSARVGGQPRIVDQVYLGAEDEVIARLTGPAGDGLTLPDDTMHRRFGDVAAVLGMLTRLDAVAVIDGLAVKAYTKGEHVLLFEATAHNTKDLKSAACWASSLTSSPSWANITNGSPPRWTAWMSGSSPTKPAGLGVDDRRGRCG